MRLLHVDKNRIKIAAILIVVFWLGAYVTSVLGTPYREAKKFIEKNEDVVKTVGAINYIILIPLGRSPGKNNELNYSLHVVGEKATGEARVRLFNSSEGWKILNAVLITGDSRSIVLKDDQ